MKEPELDSASTASLLLIAAPPAIAILVFGVIYGSVAGPLIGNTKTILSSLFIFSGAVQFTVIALVAGGAATGAVLAGAATLNMRNLLLGAVTRSRLQQGPVRRGALAWLLTDEAVGLAIAYPADPARTLVIAGGLFYFTWQVGTLLGLAGASVGTLGEAAGALFPVLFIGLAAASSSSLSIAGRAAVAGAITAGGALFFPDIQGFVAISAAIIVAVPGSKE